jgi:hypothetical protein
MQLRAPSDFDVFHMMMGSDHLHRVRPHAALCSPLLSGGHSLSSIERAIVASFSARAIGRWSITNGVGLQESPPKAKPSPVWATTQ